MNSKNSFFFPLFLILSLAVSRPSYAYAETEANVVLGVPAESSIKISVLFTKEPPAQFHAEYGTTPGTYTGESETLSDPAKGLPNLITLAGLTENTRYFYRLVYDDSSYSDEYSFRTKAAPGTEFSFTVLADCHFDPRLVGLTRDQYASVSDPPFDHDPGVWIAASQNMVDFHPIVNNNGHKEGRGDSIQDCYTDNAPDFLIDLGDTFMVEKVITNRYYSDDDIDGANGQFDYDDVDYCYEYVRTQFFSHAAHSLPIFLVTGNHEGELGKLWNNKDEEKKNLALWSVIARRKYFANPIPDGEFYTGSTVADDFDGSTRDTWFAWKWGNAQFIVLDPYWYSTGSFNNDGGWAFTLGQEQYDWLKSLLEEKDENIKYKFVFVHHLVGGSHSDEGRGRGGTETAAWFEWGGWEPNDESDPNDDEYMFAAKREGWEAPIHDLLVAGNVSAVFHGHDHVFVKQQLDGIHYIEMGQGSSDKYDNTDLASAYGYVSGDVVSSSGYMRVTVNSSEAAFHYVRAYHPDDEGLQRGNDKPPYGYTGDVDYEFVIRADSEAGDVNKSGSADLADLILCLQIVSETDTGSQIINIAADVNGDGKIGIAEAVYILRMLAVIAEDQGEKFPGTVLLGRPADASVAVNALADEDMEVYIESGTESGRYVARTDTFAIQAEIPFETLLNSLQPGKPCYYRMRWRKTGESGFRMGEEFSFHPQRQPGISFVFTVQADSHLGTDKHCDPELYKRTLMNAAADAPDFHIDLGDTFRSSKITDPDYDKIAQLYIDQRAYFGLLCRSAPLFLVLGNHELEYGYLLDGTENNIPIWSTKARKLYYPNPEPDDFYTGNAREYDFIGKRQNYYAFTWGDALFVALDPYWTTMTDPHAADKTLWDSTIGDEQYQWFKETLEKSTETFRFVFVHHVLGETRGGANAVTNGEWGDAANLETYRPGWEKTIHQLMADNNVSIFFQGHDHIFVREELDGVVYQTCPMPGDPYYSLYNADAFGGDKLPNSGHIRVFVSKSEVKVDYIRAYLPKDEAADRVNGEVFFTYTVPE
jgi:phosphodiesterase/alkaline phosphatase D-like protein